MKKIVCGGVKFGLRKDFKRFNAVYKSGLDTSCWSYNYCLYYKLIPHTIQDIFLIPINKY